MSMKNFVRNWLGLNDIQKKPVPYIMACAKVYNNGPDEPMTWDGFGLSSVKWDEEQKFFHVSLIGPPMSTANFIGFTSAFVGDTTTSHTEDEWGPAINVRVLDRANNNVEIRENFDILVIRVAD